MNMKGLSPNGAKIPVFYRAILGHFWHVDFAYSGNPKELASDTLQVSPVGLRTAAAQISAETPAEPRSSSGKFLRKLAIFR